MILSNGKILNEDFKFIDGSILIENGVIQNIYNDAMPNDYKESEIFDCQGNYILPGFIDIHTHGAMGADHLDGNISSTKTICDYLAKKGTTSILATVMTQAPEIMEKACENISKYNETASKGSHIRGIYLEGPFFSEKYKGAQHPDFLIDASISFFMELYKAANKMIKIISLAPERNNSLNFIKELNDNDEFSKVKVFLGHTESNYETAKQAFKAGAKGITHTFNCMTPIHHRNPGVITAAIEDSNIFCECVCDGIHVHPAMIKLLYKNVGKERFVTISDSIRPAGLPNGNYDSGGQSVIVEDGLAYLDKGNSENRTIAGSTVCMLDCVKNLIKWNIMSVEEAVYSASAMPAKAAGIYDVCGSISIGKSADLLIVDKDFDLKRVFINNKFLN